MDDFMKSGTQEEESIHIPPPTPQDEKQALKAK